MAVYMSELETLSALFQTLADVNRLRIIFFLEKAERSVNEVVKALKLSQPLVSHHLKVLKQVSIVQSRARRVPRSRDQALKRKGDVPLFPSLQPSWLPRWIK